MKLLITLILSCTLNAVFAQDSLSRNAYSFHVYSGLPFQKIGQTRDWYNPDFEAGFDFNYAVRIKRRFFISLGVGLNFSRYRSASFVRSWSTYNYSPWIGVYNVQNHTDDYERQTRGSYLHIRVPLQVEYMPQGKWTPYARLGAIFDARISRNSIDVYANTNQIAPENYNQPYVSNDEFLLSGAASGGIKYGKKNVELLFGLTTQLGLYDFNKNFGIERIGLSAELSIRNTIPYTNFPHQIGIDSDPNKVMPKNYFYIEGLGSAFWGSLNYERALVSKNKHRLRARLGLSVLPDSYLDLLVPIGVNWSYGLKHGIEAGVAFIPSIGKYPHSFVSPHISYRVETNKNVLLRFTTAGLWLYETDQFFVSPGISVGFGF